MMLSELDQRALVKKTSFFKQGFEPGLPTTKFKVLLIKIDAAIFFQNFTPERGGCFLVKKATFFKGLKGVAVQNFSPDVNIIAGRIAARKNMLEIGAAVTGNNGLD